MEMILLWVWNNNQLYHFQNNTSHERKPFHNERINSYRFNLRKAKPSQQIMLPGNVNPESQMMSQEIKKSL